MSQDIQHLANEANKKLAEIDQMEHGLVEKVNKTFDDYVKKIEDQKKRIINDVAEKCNQIKKSVEIEVNKMVEEQIKLQENEIEITFVEKRKKMLNQLTAEKKKEISKLRVMRHWKIEVCYILFHLLVTC